MISTIKALVKKNDTEGLCLENVPMPKMHNDSVLIKVKKTGICGTDLHIYNWDKWAKKTIKLPIVIGHEFSGVICDKGKDVKSIQINDRVSAEGHIVCGFCRNCRAGKGHLCRNTRSIGVQVSGAFSEYICVPETNVIKIPNDINDDLAAIFDPLGNAFHTALSYEIIGEDILITGAGPIGIMAAKVCQVIGARKVILTDINDERIKLAKHLGIKLSYNTKQNDLESIMEQNNIIEGFDIGLEMSGSSEALNYMIKVMNNGGKIAILGIAPTSFEVNWNEIIFKMLQIKGIYGREMYETWYKMIALLQSGLNIENVITHKFHFTDFEKAFKIIKDGNCGKIILNWS
tara:strand:- start:12563 stop:13600 length:1038 start_codon:yes stop_codon:yes gene_type:complete